jgi:hypothetical protein
MGFDSLSFAVEVKATPCAVDEIAKQVALYRTFIPEKRFLVATLFPLSSSDVAVLQAAGAKHRQLGRRFVDWCKRAQHEGSFRTGGVR